MQVEQKVRVWSRVSVCLLVMNRADCHAKSCERTVKELINGPWLLNYD